MQRKQRSKEEFNKWFNDCCYQLNLQYPEEGFDAYQFGEADTLQPRHWKEFWELFDRKEDMDIDEFGVVILQSRYERRGMSTEQAKWQASSDMGDIYIQSIIRHCIEKDVD